MTFIATEHYLSGVPLGHLEKKLPGGLVVDRYNGYNKAPCKIQYCFAHLLRKVRDFEKEFPENKEVKEFVQTIAPLLAEAMNLRSLPLDKKEFMVRAVNTKSEIIKNMNASAKHAGIQKIQDIFRENKDRLYHWAKNQAVPADNNFAERELCPLVIARKSSFGPHSDIIFKCELFKFSRKILSQITIF